MSKVFLSCILSFVFMAQSFADNKPVDILLTDQGERVAVSDVDYLLAADNDTYFQIVLKKGDPILNVQKVTFEKGTQTGITEIAGENNDMKIVGEVSSSLTLSGCRNGARITIFSLNGACVLKTKASESTVIDVSNLTAGCYILDVEGNTVKFIKK